MKKNLYCFVIISFLLLNGWSLGFSQTNLIENGGFEEWKQTKGKDNLLPDKFETVRYAKGTFVRSDDARTGKNALHVESVDKHRRIGTSYMRLEAGTYTIKFWIKGEGLLRWIKIAKEGTSLTSPKSEGQYHISPMGGTQERYKKYHEDWEEYTSVIEVTESGTYNLNMSFMYTNNPDRYFLLDDLSMVRN